MIRLRPAGVADVAILERWDTLPHVIDSGGVDDELDWSVEIGGENGIEVLIAELGSDRNDGSGGPWEPIGVVQVLDPSRDPTEYWGPETGGDVRCLDIWIGPAEHLGQGHGTQMMQQAIARCFASPDVVAVLIDPLVRNERAINFYHRVGFVDVGVRWFEDDECLVMRFDRA